MFLYLLMLLCLMYTESYKRTLTLIYGWQFKKQGVVNHMCTKDAQRDELNIVGLLLIFFI